MRRPMIVLAAAAALLTALAGPASAASHPAGVQPGSSGDAGYYATSTTPFTSVAASWVLPVASCASTNDLVAPWIGLDGFTTSTVEQIGTAIDCSSGAPVYEAWYEMYPSAPIYLNPTAYPVDAYSAVQATVVSTSTNKIQFTLTNKTRGWTYTVTKSPSAGTLRLSAEVMVESPTGTAPPMGPITFTGVRFNGVNFGTFNPVPVNSGTLHAGPIVGGNSFTVSTRTTRQP